MIEPPPSHRSPELMSRHDTALVVVDVQEKLLRAIPDAQRLVWNIQRLVDAACALGIEVLATEQYPKGLGPTIEPLAARLGPLPEKLAFSAVGCDALRARLDTLDRPNLLVCGIETHVCVQQTALDLLHAGFRVFIAADAVASRAALDREIALQRMIASGVTMTTVESAMFEWCETAAAPEFKLISQLVKQTFTVENLA